MPARNVAPTKANLLDLQQQLTFARQGHELLDQKRNILVIELLGLVDQAVDYQNQVERALEQAYESFEHAVLAMGKLRSLHLSGALNIRADIEISQRRVMGVRLPIVDTNFEEHPPYYSPLGTSFWIDDATRQFKEALSLMGRFAELKVSIMRLAREVRRTVRKVNALEKVAIPELEESVKVIAERLEENEREMFVLMKMVKDRLSKKER